MAGDIFAELRWRGLVHQCTDEALGDALRGERFTVYCGFDPTAESLTTGHLLQMLTLARLQRAGHQVIAVAGGGTGLIGDPSWRESERMLMAPEQVEGNVESIRRQLEGFLELGGEDGLLMNNADWLTELRLTGFLRDIGRHFSVNAMISKEAVKARLEAREQGISFTEFSYQLLQAYDFLHLFDEYGCRLQIGGSDQWGNVTAGVDLIRKARGEHVFGMTTPLIVLADGKKMSKSEGTAVWLSASWTSPYQFYQYWMNTSDADVADFLRWFTFLGPGRIEELESAVIEAPEQREAQRELAWEVTVLVHGEDAAEGARKASEALFGEEVASLDEEILLEALSDAPTTTRSRSSLNGGVPLVDLMVETGLVPSRSAGREAIQGGGAYVNNVRISETEREIGPTDLLHDRYLLLRRGKKTYHLVRFE